jgi:hypothetical protein
MKREEIEKAIEVSSIVLNSYFGTTNHFQVEIREKEKGKFFIFGNCRPQLIAIKKILEKK